VNVTDAVPLQAFPYARVRPLVLETLSVPSVVATVAWRVSVVSPVTSSPLRGVVVLGKEKTVVVGVRVNVGVAWATPACATTPPTEITSNIATTNKPLAFAQRRTTDLMARAGL
jgi:hypothetical protein